jgi:SlyX protein
MECKEMNEDRLVEIETKMAFQENTIKDLSDAIYSQQKQIENINKTLKLLVDQVDDSSVISPRGNLQDEKPPHY